MADSFMNFHSAAPKIPPRILCIGMPVRDLTFRIQELPAHGFKVHATHFDEICGGNGLNAAIGIVRLGARASICAAHVSRRRHKMARVEIAFVSSPTVPYSALLPAVATLLVVM